MKSLALWIIGVVLALPAWSMPRLTSQDIAELHWLAPTAAQARLRTRAAALWLDDPTAEEERWQEQLEIRLLSLERQAQRQQPANSAVVDGMLGWLVHARARSLDASSGNEVLVQTLLQGLQMPLPDAVLRAGAVWAELEERLAGIEDREPAREIGAYWADLQAQAEMVQPQEREQARTLVLVAASLADSEGPDRLEKLAALALVESDARWAGGEDLQALWQLLDALVLQAALGEQREIGTLDTLLAAVAAVDPERLRRTDESMLLVLAQLQDAAAYLAEQPVALDAAVSALTDAYFRLALFVSDASFYLDQPVREDLVAAVEGCLPNPDLVGPLPREIFQRCPERLFELLGTGLDSEELVGGDGPFAPEFLGRETGLLSWQRSRYLDGYLNWQLQADCQPPRRINMLEASILIQALASWIPQRPVFLSAQRWQTAMGAFIDRIDEQEDARRAWLDCLTGLGGQRLDPVARLLIEHGRALANLEFALETAYDEFVADQTRPGSDINLGAAVDQVTGYRPEGLTVEPCAGGSTCGARVSLPVSRALLGLFPNTYLLADQLAIGSLGLCYEEVRWTDREMRPARPGDDQVANYFGRLSFELVGTFDDSSGLETVFRERLVATERRHYLFAAASEDILGQACPDGIAGRPVASELPADRLGLVPNRLTYFAATPATADGQLVANWEQGAEWRDWFITESRVEVLEEPRPAILQARVQAEMERLVDRRERLLAGRLLGDAEDDLLSSAMAAVADNRVLLRRVLELHYPRLVRHDPTTRSALSGLDALIGREQVLGLRDAGRPLASLAEEGRTRLAGFQEFWQGLSMVLREQGQTSPEAEHARRLLSRLRSISWSEVADAESLPDR